MRIFATAATAFSLALVANAQDCASSTNCLQCIAATGAEDAACGWCATRGSPAQGTCGGDCDDSTGFLITSDGALDDNCAYQLASCQPCLDAGGVWGEVGDDTTATARCYKTAELCGAVDGAKCSGADVTCDDMTQADVNATAPDEPTPSGPGETPDVCAERTACMACGVGEECQWCATDTDFHAGTCSSTADDAKCPEASTLFPNVSDNCPLQAPTCADCAANKGVWGVFSVMDENDAPQPARRCFKNNDDCTASKDTDGKDANCSADCSTFDEADLTGTNNFKPKDDASVATVTAFFAAALAVAGALVF